MGSRHRLLFTAGNLTAPLFIVLLLIVTAQYSAAQSPNGSNNNPYFASSNFNPSMAIVIVVLISAFFLLGFFSIYIRQCSGERDSVRGAVAAAAARFRQRGLDKEVLDSFPTFIYSEVKERKIGKGSLECAVCLSEFEDDETLRLLPKCSHVFHHDCIDAWLAAHVTCPVCRSDLNADFNDLDQPEQPPAVEVIPTVEPSDPGSVRNQDHVTVEIDGVDEERKADIENLEKFVNMKRAKSRAQPARFPRSHSTGHSLVQPGENLDRFTLRLPENVRREIVDTRRLQRAKSLVAFRGEGSSRRGYRGEGSVGRAGPRLGRSDRWGSLLLRTLSVKNWGRRSDAGGSGSVRGEPASSVKGGGFVRLSDPESGSVKGEGSVKGARFNAVISPFDCYGGGKSGFDGKEVESSTAALKKV